MEAALGMSYMGKRALVCMKHVGLNVCADPFVNSAMTGTNGGIIVLVADDPSMHSSQDEQDSLIKEKVDKYVQESVLNNTIITDNHILLPSDRDGYMQLYLYSANGQFQKRLTNGQFDVTTVYGFDDATQTAYYQAAANNAMNREVYSANIKGKVTCLTPKEFSCLSASFPHILVAGRCAERLRWRV